MLLAKGRMKDGHRTRTRAPLVAGIILLVALAGLVAWFGRERERERGTPEDADPVEPREEATPPTPPEPAPAPGAPSDDGPLGEAPVPQPITPDSERIKRENEVLGTVSDAVDLGDAGKLRLMAKAYRERGFEGAHEIASGYEIIAECMDHPGPISRAPAKYYDDNHRGSILRPYLRKACFPPE
jgi:hypothetical protein